jgi:hypothetical protein
LRIFLVLSFSGYRTNSGSPCKAFSIKTRRKGCSKPSAEINLMPVPQLFFTERTLTGHSSLKRDDDRHKPISGYSAMAVAKSAFSPSRCRNSLSHALGLLP